MRILKMVFLKNMTLTLELMQIVSRWTSTPKGTVVQKSSTAQTHTPNQLLYLDHLKLLTWLVTINWTKVHLMKAPNIMQYQSAWAGIVNIHSKHHMDVSEWVSE